MYSENCNVTVNYVEPTDKVSLRILVTYKQNDVDNITLKIERNGNTIFSVPNENDDDISTTTTGDYTTTSMEFLDEGPFDRGSVEYNLVGDIVYKDEEAPKSPNLGIMIAASRISD